MILTLQDDSNDGNPLRIDKVVAYVISERGLLVFTHPDHPEAGLQVPAGTIQHSESAEEAVLREVDEETGLRDARVVAYLGSCEYDMQAFGKNEVHVRRFFQLAIDDSNSPDNWEHWERHVAGETETTPIRFHFRWMSLHEAAGSLIAGQGTMLSKVAM